MSIHKIENHELSLSFISERDSSLRMDAPTVTHRSGIPVIEMQEGDTFKIELAATTNKYLVVPSFQGINPLTGLLEREGNLLVMGRGTRCPAGHNQYLLKNGYCIECQSYWPAGNYLEVPSTSSICLEGWSYCKGKIKEFVATSEVKNGVAAQMTGDAQAFLIELYLYRGPQLSVASWMPGIPPIKAPEYPWPISPLVPGNPWPLISTGFRPLTDTPSYLSCLPPHSGIETTCDNSMAVAAGEDLAHSLQRVQSPLDEYADMPLKISMYLVNSVGI